MEDVRDERVETPVAEGGVEHIESEDDQVEVE